MDRMISFDNISKEYPDIMAVKDVTFHVKGNSIHGLLGPNGAGKTTILKMMAGICEPTSGKIYLEGEPLYHKGAPVRPLVGYLPENPPLYHDMKIDDYLKFVYSIYTYKRLNQSMLLELLDQCDLNGLDRRIIGLLSQGQRQKVGLAQALVHRPRIIILDEPLTGLDPKAIVDMRRLILQLKRKHTIIFSTHHLYEAEYLCDDVTIVDKGSVLKTGALDQIRHDLIQRKILSGKVKYWTDSIEEGVYALLDTFDLSVKVIVEKKDFYYDFSIEIPLHIDCRLELIKVLVEFHADLIELKEREPRLEGIFCSLLSSKKEGAPLKEVR